MTDGPSLNVTGGPAIDSLKNQNNNKKWNFKKMFYIIPFRRPSCHPAPCGDGGDGRQSRTCDDDVPPGRTCLQQLTDRQSSIGFDSIKNCNFPHVIFIVLFSNFFLFFRWFIIKQTDTCCRTADGPPNWVRHTSIISRFPLAIRLKMTVELEIIIGSYYKNPKFLKNKSVR